MVNRRKDKWLRAFCPEDACLAEEERFEVIESAAKDQDDNGSIWLKFFCPEAACEIEEASQLP